MDLEEDERPTSGGSESGSVRLSANRREGTTALHREGRPMGGQASS